jgi:hypothetical protein
LVISIDLKNATILRYLFADRKERAAAEQEGAGDDGNEDPRND